MIAKSTETAPADVVATEAKPKASKKAPGSPRRAPVAPKKANAGKKASPAKKEPKGAKKAKPSEAKQSVVPEPATLPAQAPPASDVAPEPKPAGKKAKGAKKVPKPAAKAKGNREGSKTTQILDLLKRPGGVSSKELMETTGWQPHSVRGFLSGTVGKKLGHTVLSIKGEDGARTYSIKA